MIELRRDMLDEFNDSLQDTINASENGQANVSANQAFLYLKDLRDVM